MSTEYWTTTNEAGSGTAWVTEYISHTPETTMRHTVLYTENTNPIDLSGDFEIHGQMPLSGDFELQFQQEYQSDYIVDNSDFRLITEEDIHRGDRLYRRHSDETRQPTWEEINHLCNMSHGPIIHPLESELQKMKDDTINLEVHKILKGLLNDDN